MNDKKNIYINEKNNITCIYNYILNRHILINSDLYKFFSENRDDIVFKYIDGLDNEQDKIYLRENYKNYLYIIRSELEYKKDSIKSVTIMLTNRCNLNCIHCCTDSSISEKDIIVKNNLDILLERVCDLNPQNIIVSGGEPLMHSNCLDILKKLKQRTSACIILSTNSILISKKNIKYIKEFVDKISISVDSYDEETASLIRGRCTYPEIENRIKLLQENNFNNIEVTATFSEFNYQNKEKFINWANEMKTDPQIREMEFEGRALINRSFFANHNYSIPITLSNIYEGKRVSKNISSCSCNAFKDSIFINYKGEIYPCISLSYEWCYLGSMFDKDYSKEKLFLNMRRLRKKFIDDILKFRDSKCYNCKNNIFCWVCPNYFIKAKENNEIDFWCNNISEKINEIVWGFYDV